jgi:hypothetical protein
MTSCVSSSSLNSESGRISGAKHKVHKGKGFNMVDGDRAVCRTGGMIYYNPSSLA